MCVLSHRPVLRASKNQFPLKLEEVTSPVSLFFSRTKTAILPYIAPLLAKITIWRSCCWITQDLWGRLPTTTALIIYSLLYWKETNREFLLSVVDFTTQSTDVQFFYTTPRWPQKRKEKINEKWRLARRFLAENSKINSCHRTSDGSAKCVSQLLHDCYLHYNNYSKFTQLLILLELVPSVFLNRLRVSLLIFFSIWSSRTPLASKMQRYLYPLPSLKTWFILSSGSDIFSDFVANPLVRTFSINSTLLRFCFNLAILGLSCFFHIVSLCCCLRSLFISRFSATISVPHARSLVAVISSVGIIDSTQDTLFSSSIIVFFLRFLNAGNLFLSYLVCTVLTLSYTPFPVRT